MKESATEMKKGIGEKHNEAGKPMAALESLVLDDEKSKKLKMDVSEQENELRAQIEVAVEKKDENAGKQKAELTPSVQDDEKNEMEEKTVEAGKTATRSSEVFDRDNDKDSDQSVKAPPKKKTKQNQILDSDDDNDDDGENKSKIADRKRKNEADPNTAKTKKKRMTKTTKTALSERRNCLRKRSSRGTSHLLQNKDKVVLDDEGIILHDFLPINKVFLDGNGEITPKKNSVPFPQVKQESTRGILSNRRVYQRLSKEGNSVKQLLILTRKMMMGNSSSGQIF